MAPGESAGSPIRAAVLGVWNLLSGVCWRAGMGCQGREVPGEEENEGLVFGGDEAEAGGDAMDDGGDWGAWGAWGGEAGGALAWRRWFGLIIRALTMLDRPMGSKMRENSMMKSMFAGPAR